MRTRLKIIIIIAFFLIVIALSVFIILNINTQKEKSRMLSGLPVFSSITLGGKSITTRDINSGPVLIVFYSYDCDYCYSELHEIIKSKNELSDTRVIFVTNYTIPDSKLDDLLSEYQPHKFFDIILDKEGVLIELFDIRSIPTTFIYGRDLNLEKRFIGKTKIETILNYCNGD